VEFYGGDWKREQLAAADAQIAAQRKEFDARWPFLIICFYLFGGQQPLVPPPSPWPSIFYDCSFWVHHPVNWDDYLYRDNYLKKILQICIKLGKLFWKD
jgi:hypothetical protein